ncbi:hypothetical protein JYT16_02805, partial [Gemmatimonas aurantiaca]|nr:hypothetical protein [Gemmatimonas aurantiaca]
MAKTKHRTTSWDLIPYIPHTIVDWYRANPEGETHVVSELNGILLCIDASGFTALTEELSKQGRGGPEILTAIINQFFEEMAGVVFAYDGDI